MIADGSLDFVFIDGDHSYTGVLSDCANYYDKVRSGGTAVRDTIMISMMLRTPSQDFFWYILTIFRHLSRTE